MAIKLRRFLEGGFGIPPHVAKTPLFEVMVFLRNVFFAGHFGDRTHDQPCVS